MWVKFKKTYTGPEGMFIVDNRYDLGEGKLKNIDKKFYIKSCPPWEDGVDKTEVARQAKLGEIDKQKHQIIDVQYQIQLQQSKVDETFKTLYEQEELAEDDPSALNEFNAQLLQLDGQIENLHIKKLQLELEYEESVLGKLEKEFDDEFGKEQKTEPSGDGKGKGNTANANGQTNPAWKGQSKAKVKSKKSKVKTSKKTTRKKATKK